jgi:hypothetical protein
MSQDSRKAMHGDGSPVDQFTLKAGSFFITPNNINYGWWDSWQREVLGMLEISQGNLSFLTPSQNRRECIHIVGVSIREKNRGCGLFRAYMELLNSLADTSGCCLYLCARAFKVDIPKIHDEKTFLKYIRDMPGFDYYKDKSKEIWQSELLRRKYWEFGFSGLVIEDEDMDDQLWKRFACGYCPTTASDEMKRAFGERLNADETVFLSNFPTIYDSERRRNRKRKCEERLAT